MNIAGKEIEFDERPRHKSVVAVQNLMTDWLLKNIDLENIDGGLPIEAAMKQQVLRNPTLLLEVQELEASLAIDQTIMLSTSMTYKELKILKDTLYEDEYLKMYDISMEALGGSADSFFEIYDSDSNLNLKSQKKEKSTVSESATSDHPLEISSEIPIEHYQEKTPTTPD